MSLREPAICIRATDYSETSQVLRFLTRGSGIVTVLAKGSKRPKSKSGGPLDLLSEGQLVFALPPSGAMGTLFEFAETVSRRVLRGDAARLNTALYMIELTGLLLGEGDPHPETFDLLHNALQRVGHAEAPVAAVLAYFQWRILRHAGLLGQLDSCGQCGTHMLCEHPKGPVFFNSARGTLLCEACQGSVDQDQDQGQGQGQDQKVRVDASALGGLAGLQAARGRPGTTLSDDQVAAVNRLLWYHACYQSGKSLKMARHVIP